MKTIREFMSADRYVFDFGLCSTKNGFAQVDTSQDASYFGTWANPERLIIINYCEGDVTTQIADNKAEFAEEIRKIKAWHEEMEMKFLGIDPGFSKSLAAKFRDLGLADLLH
ncbi:MAG: hypothetical protein JRI72_00430 [Deltaproteobacteria bacterium]|nr:hypothetical protein [Deltaproteobacteria bacterium]